MITTPISLGSNEVHIWVIPLDQNPLDGMDLYQYLSQDEINRAERFHFDKHRRRFAISHNALRQILAMYLDVNPAEIKYDQTSHGKPWLTGPFKEGGLFFNLTHSHELALTAVTRRGEIGIDVEYLKDFVDIDGIATRFFSTLEQAVYLDLPEDQKVKGFYNCWTRKEAFIKAIGEGLSHPLDKFDVTLAPGDTPRFLRIGEEEDDSSKWTLESIDSISGYVGAVALRDIGIQFQFFEFE